MLHFFTLQTEEPPVICLICKPTAWECKPKGWEHTYQVNQLCLWQLLHNSLMLLEILESYSCMLQLIFIKFRWFLFLTKMLKYRTSGAAISILFMRWHGRLYFIITAPTLPFNCHQCYDYILQNVTFGAVIVHVAICIHIIHICISLCHAELCMWCYCFAVQMDMEL